MFKKQLILLIALFCSAGLCFGSATAAFAKVGISTADASAVSSMPSDYILDLGNGFFRTQLLYGNPCPVFGGSLRGSLLTRNVLRKYVCYKLGWFF